MKVKLITGVLYPSGSRTAAGTVLDVTDEKGADWIKRGIAEKAPAPVVITERRGDDGIPISQKRK